MRVALEAEQAWGVDEAEGADRDVLALRPDEPDALHMLGVLCHERGDNDEAIALTLRALDLTGSCVPFMRTNLGIVLAESGDDVHDAKVAAMSARHEAMLAKRRAAK